MPEKSLTVSDLSWALQQDATAKNDKAAALDQQIADTSAGPGLVSRLATAALKTAKAVVTTAGLCTVAGVALTALYAWQAPQMLQGGAVLGETLIPNVILAPVMLSTFITPVVGMMAGAENVIMAINKNKWLNQNAAEDAAELRNKAGVEGRLAGHFDQWKVALEKP